MNDPVIPAEAECFLLGHLWPNPASFTGLIKCVRCGQRIG